MGLLPKEAADTAAAAAAHLWHLTWQIGGRPGHTPEVDRWRDLAAELTILSERLRAQAVGRRRPVIGEEERALVLEALRGAVLEVFARFDSRSQTNEDRPGATIGRLGSGGRAV